MKFIKGSFVITLILFYITFINSLQAQDIHFSQLNKNPLLLNPSYAGFYTGVHRGGLSYKTQWKSMGSPYKTYSAFYDALIFRNKWKKDKFGVGIVLYSDKAGDTRMGQTIVSGTFSYTKLLTDKNAFLFGFQCGYAQNSVNLANSTWDNQFNGRFFDPNLPSNEQNYSDNYSYIDYTGGIGWCYRPNNYLKSSSGISLHHLSQPKYKFSSNTPMDLYRKLIIHNTTEIYTQNDKRSLEPSFIYTKQGTLQEFIAGCMIRLQLREKSLYTDLVNETVFSFGGYYRVADAFIFATRLNYQNFEINLSYDINTSKARNFTKSNGGFEISIIYIHPDKAIIPIKGVPKFF
jgi:type IX secretion system PorP/SprF family membrane protein